MAKIIRSDITCFTAVLIWKCYKKWSLTITVLPQSLAGFKGGRFAAEKEGLSEEGRRKGREGRGWRQREIGGEKGWREKRESRLLSPCKNSCGRQCGLRHWTPSRAESTSIGKIASCRRTFIGLRQTASNQPKVFKKALFSNVVVVVDDCYETYQEYVLNLSGCSTLQRGAVRGLLCQTPQERTTRTISH